MLGTHPITVISVLVVCMSCHHVKRAFCKLGLCAAGHWKRPNAYYVGKLSPGGPKKEVQKCISIHTQWSNGYHFAQKVFFTAFGNQLREVSF